MELAVIIPDTHVPYEHKKAFALVQDVIKHHKSQIKEIVFLGDFADFYAVNSHGKHPQMLHNLTEEVEKVIECFDWFDKTVPGAKKIFIEGNHEFRLERFIQNVCPQLFGVTSTEHILKIAGRPNWTFVPYGPNQSYRILGSYLKARHEPLASSAKSTASKALCSLVYGHIHRIEESHIVGLDGTNHVCFSVGWLGDKRMDKIYGYVKHHHQWQLGFGLVYVDPKSGLFYHQKIPILQTGGEVSCVVNGKRFTK